MNAFATCVRAAIVSRYGLTSSALLQLTMLHLRVVITANEVSLFDSVGSEDRSVGRAG